MKAKELLKYAAASAMMLLAACNEDSPVTNPPVDNRPVEIDRTQFAKGADVSWLTQLEAEGEKFYAPDGTQMECMELLRDHCGVNAIRLRVWVNPAEGWNNIDDVVVKARRANSLGLRVMIDFHFSDSWADPSKQTIPAAWTDYDLDGLKAAVSAHVNDMMASLASCGIEPEWVQIGNETPQGFLWPVGHIDNADNFVALVNSGYDAVKASFPEAKVIVHLNKGEDIYAYNKIFGTLKAKGGKFDMIGMSSYPNPDDWTTRINNLVSNVATLTAEYGVPVMICEIGMDYTEAETCKAVIADLMAKTANLDVAGIFYWEPEAPAGYNDGYKKGCFDNGTPTVALDPFK
ncbi:MAG: arabinogalactan endo-1,4-beta-galactosidase [Bacteroides sp.]|nr:arabinogalactan endo-1,4-beta-galactosidase [Bacteroides sp.]